MKEKLLTLVYVLKYGNDKKAGLPTEVLLGQKRRGFGMGNW